MLEGARRGATESTCVKGRGRINPWQLMNHVSGNQIKSNQIKSKNVNKEQSISCLPPSSVVSMAKCLTIHDILDGSLSPLPRPLPGLPRGPLGAVAGGVRDVRGLRGRGLCQRHGRRLQGLDLTHKDADKDTDKDTRTHTRIQTHRHRRIGTDRTTK